MSDSVRVEPTPIQRNRRDIAIELVQLFLEHGNYTQDQITEEKIAELYASYFKKAVECDQGKY